MNTMVTPYKQRNTQMLKLISIVIGCLLLVYLCYSYISGMQLSDIFCLTVTTATIVYTMIYCSYDISHRFILMCFNFSYFVFLTGGLLTVALTGGSLSAYVGVNAEATSHTCHCLAISILIVNMTYVLFDGSKRAALSDRQPAHNKKRGKPLAKGTEQVIFILFIVTLIGKLGGAIIQYQFLSEYTYVDSYIISYNKPFYVWIPESIFYFVMCLWLFTNPKKKTFLLFFTCILIVEAIVLFSGDRAEPMSVLLILAFYIYKRSKAEEDFIRITKGKVLVILALIPILMITMQAVKRTRINESFTMESGVFQEFMEEQGISAHVIAKGYVSRDTITRIGGSSYTFGSLRNYLKQNRVTRILLGTQSYASNSVEAATSGDSFGSTLAYLWFRTTFLGGIGCGSSYIAELYHDGGLLQMCIGSVIFSLAFLVLSKWMQRSAGVYASAFILMICKQVIILPRSNCFTWLTSAFSMQNLMVLALLILVNFLFQSNAGKKEKTV